jgi:hypothetical protein
MGVASKGPTFYFRQKVQIPNEGRLGVRLSILYSKMRPSNSQSYSLLNIKIKKIEAQPYLAITVSQVLFLTVEAVLVIAFTTTPPHPPTPSPIPYKTFIKIYNFYNITSCYTRRCSGFLVC